MSTVIPPTSNRRRIYHFLQRSLRFHACCTVGTELDVTDLVAAIEAGKARGEDIGFAAAVTKATALLMREYPQFNRHLFHGLLGGRREVQFDAINAAVMVQRRDDAGEDVLFPALIRDAERASVGEIHATLRRYKQAPLAELPEYQKLAKLKKLPTPLRVLMSYKLRSDAKFYEDNFVGTYGISAYAGAASVPISTGHALAPTACSFFVGSVTDKPWVVAGAVVPRKILQLSVVADHYLVDGVEIVAALSRLGALLADPAALGLAPAPAAQVKAA